MSTTDYRFGKPKTTKITTLSDIPEKYWPEWYKQALAQGNIIDDRTALMAAQAANNARESERNAKLEAKRHAEEQRIMAEREKQEREKRERREKAYANLPEHQLKMILNGLHYECSHCRQLQYAEYYNHTKSCTAQRGRDAEPGLRLLAHEYRIGKIIRLDDEMFKNLKETGKITLELER